MQEGKQHIKSPKETGINEIRQKFVSKNVKAGLTNPPIYIYIKA